MPLIQVLSDKKRAVYQKVPTFNAKERKYFLELPASLKLKVHAFPNTSNKVGFRLMFGYFLATKKFYPPEEFHPKDIRYLCNQYGLMPFGFDLDSYKSSTYSRHRQIILEHFAFQAYQPKIHRHLIRDAIEEQIYSWEAPNLIVQFILDWLEWRRIERPTYYNLQLILTQSIRNRNRVVKQKFGKLLKSDHKQALEQLIVKEVGGGREEYVLSTLHKLSPSDSPTQIRANIAKLETIQHIFEQINPLIEQLSLNDNAIRHFGELVQNTESSHIIRKESIDRHFY